MKLGLLLLALGAAVSQPLRIEQGATWSKAFDTDRDLTGCTLGMEIRTSSSGTLLAAPTLTTTSASAGTFTASLTANQTGQLTRSGIYDVEATCSSTVYRLFEGSVTLSLGVTTDEVSPGAFPAPGTPPGELYLRRSYTWAHDSAPLLFAWTPDDTHGVPHSAFELQLGGSDFFGERDHTAGEGWNCTRLTGEPKLCDQWEDHYRTGPGGTKLWMERFIEVENAAHTFTLRPMFFQFDLGDNSSAWTFAASGAAGYMLHQVNGNDILKLVADGTQVLGGRGLSWTGTGGKNMLYAQNNLGSNTHLVLSLDQFGRIPLGPGNVIMVGTSSAVVGGEQSMAFFGQALATKRTVSGSQYGNPAVASLLTALGDSGYGLITDSTTAGVTTATVNVSAAPSMGTCTSSERGQFQYVDDSNDTAVSHLCFCGTAADDTTYGWRRADAPGAACP